MDRHPAPIQVTVLQRPDASSPQSLTAPHLRGKEQGPGHRKPPRHKSEGLPADSCLSQTPSCPSRGQGLQLRPPPSTVSFRHPRGGGGGAGVADKPQVTRTPLLAKSLQGPPGAFTSRPPAAHEPRGPGCSSAHPTAPGTPLSRPLHRNPKRMRVRSPQSPEGESVPSPHGTQGLDRIPPRSPKVNLGREPGF